MKPTADDSDIRTLAWEVVRRLAPAEEVTFDLQCDSYFADPKRALTNDGRRQKNDRLGSGISDIVENTVPIITPIVLAVITELVTRTVSQGVENSFKKAGRAISAAIRRLAGRPASNMKEPILDTSTQEETEIRKVIVEVVIKNGETIDIASRIADALLSGEADTIGKSAPDLSAADPESLDGDAAS